MPRAPRQRTIKVVERPLGQFQCAGRAHAAKMMFEIDPAQMPQEYLDTAIHETLHLLHPAMDEKDVHQTARGISGVLWTLGFRRTHL